MRKFFFCSVFFALLACILGCIGEAKSTDLPVPGDTAVIPEKVSGALQEPKKPTGDTLSINAVGDVMFGSNFPDDSPFPPNGGKNLLDPFSEYFKDADINFANVEGVFLDSGGTPKGIGKNVYCFRQPREMAQIFKENGFNLLSIANNHIADFGREGIQSTEQTLGGLGIAFAGTLGQPVATLKIRDISIGFAAFAPHNGCADMNDLAAAEATVRKLKAENNVVVISFHGGGEGEKFQHVTREREIFFRQDRGNVYDFAHRMVDAGADVVLGHGPHVLRAQELYHNKFIAYSLGNFCTYGQFNLKGVNGLAALLQLKINSNGDFLWGRIVSGRQLGEGGPVKDGDAAAFNKIRSLTAEDIPNSGLAFEDGGILKKKN